MTFALAQSSAELHAQSAWVEAAAKAEHVRAVIMRAADASRGAVSTLKLIGPAVTHGGSLWRSRAGARREGLPRQSSGARAGPVAPRSGAALT